MEQAIQRTMDIQADIRREAKDKNSLQNFLRNLTMEDTDTKESEAKKEDENQIDSSDKKEGENKPVFGDIILRPTGQENEIRFSV